VLRIVLQLQAGLVRLQAIMHAVRYQRAGPGKGRTGAAAARLVAASSMAGGPASSPIGAVPQGSFRTDSYLDGLGAAGDGDGLRE
jgi:hypothetical protein